MRASKRIVVAIDLGGTKILAGAVDVKGNILSRAYQSTQLSSSPSPILAQIMELIEQTIKGLQKAEVVCIGLCTPGLVDKESGEILYASNLPFRNLPLQQILQERFSIPVAIENDAKAAALGEFHHGAGKGVKNLLYVTVGTGIGGAIIINKRLYRGSANMAGEFGHITINSKGPRCECGNVGCLDMYASGRAIAKRAMEYIKAGHPTLITSMTDERGDISAKDIVKAARQGDQLAAQIVQQAGEYLGIGLVNLIQIFNPERIVIGGGVSRAGRLILDPVYRIIHERAFQAAVKGLSIIPAQLGHDAGLLGVAALVLTEAAC